MNWVLFISLLFGLQIFCLAVGKIVSRGLKSNQDYYLAGKTVGFFPLLMTLIATQVGGGLVLGASQEAYTYGWSVILYPLGQSLGFILLACGIGRRMAESGASTVAELCEKAFGSRPLRQSASILSMVSLFMIFVAQVVASKKFLVSFGFNELWIFFSFWLLVISYTVVGGLKAVIITDIIQALFFIAVFFIALVFSGGSHVQSAAAFSEDPSSKMLGWLTMPLLFMAIEQDMGQRCFAADSPKTVTSASFTAAIVTLSICTIPVYFGVLAKALSLEIPEGGSVFMTVIQAVTNPSITALVACAVLAAIISTAISLINAISSNLTQDFSWKTGPRRGDEIRLARLLTTCIAVLGIGVSFYFDSIVGLLIQSYDLSVSCLFIPVMMALFKKKGRAFSAWMSFLGGGLSFFFFSFIPAEAPKEILCVFISFCGYVLSERFKK